MFFCFITAFIIIIIISIAMSFGGKNVLCFLDFVQLAFRAVFSKPLPQGDRPSCSFHLKPYSSMPVLLDQELIKTCNY